MSQKVTPPLAPSPAAAQRRSWVAPRVEDLPRLTDLTLQSQGGIPGDCQTQGSTCFA